MTAREGPPSERLRALPPSAKLVAKELQRHGPLKFEELRERCWLARSTLSFALAELRDEGLLDESATVESPEGSEFNIRT